MKATLFSKDWWQTRLSRSQAFYLAVAIYLTGSLLTLLAEGILVALGSGMRFHAMGPLIAGATYALSVWLRSLGARYQPGTRSLLVITHVAICFVVIALSKV